ncbi:hypothetical protein MHU86_24435 [Fragilaria crotonensis]|nr:hypothetical protein MHU86_24435 [Fragilaria crotonensis]
MLLYCPQTLARHRVRRQPGRQVLPQPETKPRVRRQNSRSLHRTSDMGMIVKPTGTLDLDCYVDADFAGLHGRVIPIVLRPPRSLELGTSSRSADVPFCEISPPK